jgi:hypothetical protein
MVGTPLRNRGCGQADQQFTAFHQAPPYERSSRYLGATHVSSSNGINTIREECSDFGNLAEPLSVAPMVIEAGGGSGRLDGM